MPPCLSKEQEEEVEQWIRQEHDSGSAPTRSQIRKHIESNYRDVNELSKSWVHMFLDRHPDMKELIPKLVVRLLTPEQERILAKEIQAIDAKGNLATNIQIQDYVTKSFEIRPSAGWITGFCKRYSMPCNRNYTQRHIADKKLDHSQHQITHASTFGGEKGNENKSDTQQALQQERHESGPITKSDTEYLRFHSKGYMVVDMFMNWVSDNGDQISQEAAYYYYCHKVAKQSDG